MAEARKGKVWLARKVEGTALAETALGLGLELGQALGPELELGQALEETTLAERFVGLIQTEVQVQAQAQAPLESSPIR